MLLSSPSTPLRRGYFFSSHYITAARTTKAARRRAAKAAGPSSSYDLETAHVPTDAAPCQARRRPFVGAGCAPCIPLRQRCATASAFVVEGLANPDGGAVVVRRDGFEWGAEAPEAWWRVAVECGPWCLGVGLVPHRWREGLDQLVAAVAGLTAANDWTWWGSPF